MKKFLAILLAAILFVVVGSYIITGYNDESSVETIVIVPKF